MASNVEVHSNSMLPAAALRAHEGMPCAMLHVLIHS